MPSSITHRLPFACSLVADAPELPVLSVRSRAWALLFVLMVSGCASVLPQQPPVLNALALPARWSAVGPDTVTAPP